MNIYAGRDLLDLLKGKYAFLDNDFLSLAFHDEEVANFLIDTLSVGYLLIDPFTEFEFLRSVFLPQQRNLREMFVAQPIFYPVANHQDIFIKVQENALLLSKIYAQHNLSQGISLVDLFVAARLMYLSHSAIVITGNKKHFPNFLFNTLTVFNIEQNDGSVKPISVLEFSNCKFESCFHDLQQLEN